MLMQFQSKTWDIYFTHRCSLFVRTDNIAQVYIHHIHPTTNGKRFFNKIVAMFPFETLKQSLILKWQKNIHALKNVPFFFKMATYSWNLARSNIIDSWKFTDIAFLPKNVKFQFDCQVIVYNCIANKNSFVKYLVFTLPGNEESTLIHFEQAVGFKIHWFLLLNIWNRIFEFLEKQDYYLTSVHRSQTAPSCRASGTSRFQSSWKYLVILCFWKSIIMSIWIIWNWKSKLRLLQKWFVFTFALQCRVWKENSVSK